MAAVRPNVRHTGFVGNDVQDGEVALRVARQPAGHFGQRATIVGRRCIKGAVHGARGLVTGDTSQPSGHALWVILPCAQTSSQPATALRPPTCAGQGFGTSRALVCSQIITGARVPLSAPMSPLFAEASRLPCEVVAIPVGGRPEDGICSEAGAVRSATPIGEAGLAATRPRAALAEACPWLAAGAQATVPSVAKMQRRCRVDARTARRRG